MAGLHVKVTYENGDVLTGVTDEDGDIEYAYTLSDGSVDDKFIPRDFIESIELVDDPSVSASMISVTCAWATCTLPRMAMNTPSRHLIRPRPIPP